MTRRFLLLFLLTVVMFTIGIGVAVAGGNQEAAEGETVTLRFVYRTGTGGLTGSTNRAIARFEDKHPNISIDFQQPAGDWVTNIRVMLASGEKIDLMAMDDEIYPSFVDTGLLHDLTDWTKKDFDTDDFLLSALAVYDWFGKYYAVPFYGSAVALYYNKDLFDKHGIPYPPKSGSSYMWDKFLEDCKKMTKDTDADGKIDQFGFGLKAWWPYWQTRMWRNGGGLYARDMSESIINKPESVEALKMIVLFII